MTPQVSMLAHLRLAGALVLDDNMSDFPANPKIGTLVIKDFALYAYITVLGVTNWYPLVQAPKQYVYQQTAPATEWVINHNLSSSDVWWQIQDSNGQLMTPMDVQIIDNNTFKLEFSEPVQGKVLVLSGGTDPSDSGAKGDAGLSAYDIAVKNGFTGTEQQWLASLQGIEGPQGEQGPPGISTRLITASFPGTVAAITGTLRWYPPANAVVQAVYLACSSVGSGSNLIADVLKNGASVFAPGSQPTLPAGVNKTNDFVIDSTKGSMTVNDYLTINVVQTNGCSDLVVFIKYTTLGA